MAQQDPIPPDLGQRAYAAYGEVTGGLTHDGRPMPVWEELGEQIQTAWTVSARSIWDAASEGGTR
ncbi:hypothetical protein PYK79_31745 [Streptomyces sp. ID05-04B]|uniref:hypothetical protein n=1 Tax=Streptomyces sp. ID05-04B TaxID=3028661 RepID=UPI0029C10E56|nr:hypothetical protein [Streptomyces sp. ID05-04B]MDX5566907.1 hypothetical protein [Streptomyces sp. ID05-04B]